MPVFFPQLLHVLVAFVVTLLRLLGSKDTPQTVHETNGITWETCISAISGCKGVTDFVTSSDDADDEALGSIIKKCRQVDDFFALFVPETMKQSPGLYYSMELAPMLTDTLP